MLKFVSFFQVERKREKPSSGFCPAKDSSLGCSRGVHKVNHGHTGANAHKREQNSQEREMKKAF